jgi:hypothetical protein
VIVKAIGGIGKAVALPAPGARMLAMASALAVAACTDFEGLKLPEGADATAVGTTSLPTTCGHLEPPARPLVPTVPGAMDFTVAVRVIDVGDSPDGSPQTIGYDLDSTCTTADAGASCIEPSWATANHADGPLGVDNAVGTELLAVRGNNPSSATLGNEEAASGVLTVGIRVLGYNGDETQSDLTVAYYGLAFHAPPDGGATVPLWDGTDAWDAYTDWLVAPADDAGYSVERPLALDTHAWVTTGPSGPRTLVSRYAGPVLFGAAMYHMRDVILTAKIVSADGGGWSLADGVVAARVPVDDLLHGLVFVPGADGNPLCQRTEDYGFVKGITCAYADINSLGTDDGKHPCDAASWAWRLVSLAPVQLVGIRDHGVPEGGTCAPGLSPADDTCNR